jgi:hypothetical protein
VIRGLLLGACLLLLTACAAQPGPLLLGHDTTSCAPSDQYTEVVAGVAIANPDGRDVTIDGVEFATTDGIDVITIWLVDADPQDDGTTLGYGLEAFPPDTRTRPSWDARIDAAGATLPAGHDSFLVAHLRSTADDGAVDGLTVNYSVGSTQYTATTNARVGFSSTGGDCTV